MNDCEVNGCFNVKESSDGIHCSYHKTNNREVVRFSSTLTSPYNDCATVVDYDDRVWMVISELQVKQMPKNLFKEVYKVGRNFSDAQKKAQEIRGDLLFSPSPLSSFIGSKADEKMYVGNFFTENRITKTSFSNIGNPDDYIRPYDIISVDRGSYHHYATYIGKGWVCNYTGETGACIDTWQNFIGKKGGSSSSLSSTSEGGGMVTRHHPLLPFKSETIIAEDMAKSIVSKIGKKGGGINEYCLANRNCEHFCNELVLGINYCRQAEGRDYFVKNYCPTGSCCKDKPINNGKDGNICLKDERSESFTKFFNLGGSFNPLLMLGSSSYEVNKEKEKIEQYVQETKAYQVVPDFIVKINTHRLT